MGDMAVHFSHGNDEWATPKDFFDFMNGYFGYDLDAAALKETALCDRYFGPDQHDPVRRDALNVPWGSVGFPSRVWCNPPYSLCRQFVTKARDEAFAGNVTAVELLIPARTDTRYWHDVIMPVASAVGLVKGRLKFGGAKNGAPFPSCVVTFLRIDQGTFFRPHFYQIVKTPTGWERIG